MLSLNCKNVQHVKIYLPCNFEVNPITHFDRLCKLEKRGVGSYVKLGSAVVAILVSVLKCRTQFWKRITQESFQQSLVEIGSVVSEEKIFNQTKTTGVTSEARTAYSPGSPEFTIDVLCGSCLDCFCIVL
jgi:hypothetical protein